MKSLEFPLNKKVILDITSKKLYCFKTVAQLMAIALKLIMIV